MILLEYAFERIGMPNMIWAVGVKEPGIRVPRRHSASRDTATPAASPGERLWTPDGFENVCMFHLAGHSVGGCTKMVRGREDGAPSPMTNFSPSPPVCARLRRLGSRSCTVRGLVLSLARAAGCRVLASALTAPLPRAREAVWGSAVVDDDGEAWPRRQLRWVSRIAEIGQAYVDEVR